MIPIDPQKLHAVERITRQHGALLIVDEMLSGFRAGYPGEYLNLGLEPDMATWGKATANGFSFCALTGRADIMELGGIRQTEQPKVFLLSSTHGGETHALAAALKVLEIYRTEDVIGRMRALCASFAEGTAKIVRELGLEAHIPQHAAPWRVFHLFRDAEGRISAPMRTLFLQEMIAGGVLYQGVFLPCFTHTDEDMAQVLAAFRHAATVFKQALSGRIEDYLVGPATRPVFRKYNGCAGVCPSKPCPNEALCQRSPAPHVR
jgi:glutamate-1-semialdehyde 2,1-aminomutase